MKHLLRKGWFASLALAASPAFAQDVRPVNYFQPVVNLSRPAPITGAVPDAGTELDFKSVTVGQPTPLVRGKIEIEAAKPLPSPAPVTPPVIDIIRPVPLQTPVTGIPMSQQKDFVPPQPKIVQPMPKGTPMGDPVIIQSPGMTVPEGTVMYPGAAGAPVVSGDSCDCLPGSGGSVIAPGSGGFGRLRSRLGTSTWTNDIVGDSCGCAMESACNTCGDGCLPRPNRFWFRGEYLLWSFSGSPVPPLVTTSSNGLPATFGNPTTSVLYNSIDNPLRSGAQFTLGTWLPNYEDWGLEGSFFFIGQRDTGFDVNSNSYPVLSMPYFDVGRAAGPNVPSSENEAVPGVITGNINISTYTTMSGFEVNLRRKLACGPRFWLDGLIGYRNINVEDSIVMTRNFTITPPGVAPATFNIFDSFRTANNFNGGQIGLDGEYKLIDRLSLRGTFKLALGNMSQAIDIDGASQQRIGNGAITRETGGVYALTTNIGHHTRNTFTAIPEFGLKINYDVTDNLRLYAGYSALYLPDVLRAGNQIDTTVNSNYIPFVRNNPAVAPFANTGPQRPAVLFNSSGMWAHGVNFGLEYHY
jgi:hypothetical protein